MGNVSDIKECKEDGSMYIEVGKTIKLCHVWKMILRKNEGIQSIDVPDANGT